MEVLFVMGKNVMMPHALFMRIVDLLESWDTPERHELRFEYRDILRELKVKAQRLELHEAYSKIVSASDEDAKIDARIDYLRKRACIGDVAPERSF